MDTTTEGDTFCGAFSVCLLETNDIVKSATATLSVLKLGAQSSIPSRLQVDEFLK